MRLVFAGTPEFAERALVALLAAGHDVPLVLTQPDRPAGRGMRLTESPVKRTAAAKGIPVFQPRTLRDPDAMERIRSVGAEVLVVAAYGLILPGEALRIAPRGAINIHASLLPRWRGATPIQRALLAGDAATGITIMQMDEGLDTGPMLLRRSIAVSPEDDAGSLHDRLAALGAEMIVETLGATGIEATPQPVDGVTYAAKITRADTMLDWSRSAPELERQVRAMRPSPGAQTTLDGEPLKIWRARTTEGIGEAGEVLSAEASGIRVACADGALILEEVQRAGGKRLAVSQFLHGASIGAGVRLGR